MKTVFIVLGLLFGLVGQATAYTLFVVAHDVETKPIRGELRFCERANLRGLVCGQEHKVFGKKRFLVQDWWSPETYVQAMTWIASPIVVDVLPTADGRGIVIYYEDQTAAVRGVPQAR